MYLIRDIFQCKPGKAKDLAEKFKKTFASMEGKDAFRHPRVMVDAVAGYWTVVLEAEAETLADFERHMAEYSNRADVRTAMEGYMDLVTGGKREIFRVL